MSETPDNPIDEEQFWGLVEAMGDPVRSKLLIAIADGQSEPASVRQLAARVNEPLRRVRYHLGVMAEKGLIFVASKRTRRGASEHYYRVAQSLVISTEQHDSLDPAQNRQIAVQNMKAIVTSAASAFAAETFYARRGYAVIRVSGKLDEQGWSELGAIHEAALEAAQSVFASSEKRLAVSDEKSEEPINSVAAFLLFQTPPEVRPDRG